jgi:tripartite-type tricarboxylate transporter receptor subunit TctC
MNANLNRRQYLIVSCALAVAALSGAQALAQSYPAKAVKVVVPYSPGSNPDVATRIVMQALADKLGQPFVMDTKIGAGGSIGLSAGAKAAPDGYTITTGHVGGLAINPSIYDKLPYDTAKDFMPIMQMYKSPLLLVVAENSPYKTLADLIAAAKARPGTITFSSGGNGNGAHLSGESLSALSGVSMKHIPYKTVSDALVGVVSGDITFSFGNLSLGMPLVKGKKLRALALSGDARMAEYPDLPLVGDTVKGFEFHDWSGMLAPTGTPPAIVAKLQRDISAVLAQPEVIRHMRAQGLIPVQNTSEEFGKFVDSEQKKWGLLAKSINLKLN